jgi:hypothetical protein
MLLGSAVVVPNPKVADVTWETALKLSEGLVLVEEVGGA